MRAGSNGPRGKGTQGAPQLGMEPGSMREAARRKAGTAGREKARCAAVSGGCGASEIQCLCTWLRGYVGGRGAIKPITRRALPVEDQSRRQAMRSRTIGRALNAVSAGA